MFNITAKLKKIKETEYTNKDGEILPKVELIMVTEGKTETIYVQKEIHKDIKETLKEGRYYKVPVKIFVKSGIKDGKAWGFANVSINTNESIEELED